MCSSSTASCALHSTAPTRARHSSWQRRSPHSMLTHDPRRGSQTRHVAQQALQRKRPHKGCCEALNRSATDLSAPELPHVEDQSHLHPAEPEPVSGGAGCRPRAAECVEPCTPPSSNLVRVEREAGQEQRKTSTRPSSNLVRVELGAASARRSREPLTYTTPSSNVVRAELGVGQPASAADYRSHGACHSCHLREP